jgi:hypothetical protein
MTVRHLCLFPTFTFTSFFKIRNTTLENLFPYTLVAMVPETALQFSGFVDFCEKQVYVWPGPSFTIYCSFFFKFFQVFVFPALFSLLFTCNLKL